MRLNLPACLAALPVLGACGSQPAPSGHEVDRAVAHADAQAKKAEKIEESKPPLARPGASPIPAAFQARWGLAPADCDPARDDAKGLMVVGGDSLRFYESRARLSRLIGSWPEKLEAEFAFAGEGQTWTRTITLALTGSSNILVRTEADTSLRYRRCPRE